MDHQDLLDRLKKHGCRMTPQRTIIIDLLIKHQHSLISIDTLLANAKALNPAINATTIYRNIDLLSEMDLLYSRNTDDGSKLYKLICHTAHHHHIICSHCGKMLPIDYCPIVPQLESLVKDSGFILEAHNLELIGLCPDCQKNPSL